MTGYLETLTDKSNFGQIVVQTFPLVGNYGVIPSDFESDTIGPSAYIVKSWCQEPSNFRSEGRLDTFFEEKDVVGLCGIDTRSLTKLLRENGTMKGMITSDPKKATPEIMKAHKAENAVRAVSTKEMYVVEERANDGSELIGLKKIALLDYGVKKSMIEELKDGSGRRGAKVYVLPCDTTASQIAELGVDGIVLSSGPGAPDENPELIANIKDMINLEIPILAVGLGHLMLALAKGFEVEKMKHGHRGANQPVKNPSDRKIYITAQGHDYAVKQDSIDEKMAFEWFVNVNDGTNEGMIYKDKIALSVQFSPEGCAGPTDLIKIVYDKFFGFMK